MTVSSWLLKQEYPVISSCLWYEPYEADNHSEALSAVQTAGGRWCRKISELAQH